jgi:ABC-type uncharacterized transport system permease subunit
MRQSKPILLVGGATVSSILWIATGVFVGGLLVLGTLVLIVVYLDELRGKL